MALSASPRATAVNSSSRRSGESTPSNCSTTALVTLPSPRATICSTRLRLSRTLPSATRATCCKAAGSKSIFSSVRMRERCCVSTFSGIALRLNCRHLERTVAGNLLVSVVASRNLTCSGGSSSVFKRALKLLVENICTSSIR